MPVHSTREDPVLGTMLTNGLRALVLAVHPGSSISHGIRFFLRPLGCFGVTGKILLRFSFDLKFENTYSVSSSVSVRRFSVRRIIVPNERAWIYYKGG